LQVAAAVAVMGILAAEAALEQELEAMLVALVAVVVVDRVPLELMVIITRPVTHVMAFSKTALVGVEDAYFPELVVLAA
jgi:hypothetical protein